MDVSTLSNSWLRLTREPLRAMWAPALLVLPRTTLPKLPSPISLRISNLSSRHTAGEAAVCDQPRNVASIATVIVLNCPDRRSQGLAELLRLSIAFVSVLDTDDRTEPFLVSESIPVARTDRGASYLSVTSGQPVEIKVWQSNNQRSGTVEQFGEWRHNARRKGTSIKIRGNADDACPV